MTCDTHREQLGLYVDGELGADEIADVEGHLAYCADCAAELSALRDIARDLGPQDEIAVPETLWSAIDARLSEPAKPAVRFSPASPAAPGRRLRGPLWALAAVVTLAIGLGIIGSSLTGSKVEASAVDFSELLDAVEVDPQAAFQTFIRTYAGRPASSAEAKRYARELNFDIPEVLPSGFKLGEVYLLEFGGSPGIAASYYREDEFLAAIFHQPAKEVSRCTHKNCKCMIGKNGTCKCKHRAGRWKMVNTTDRSTCHCVLSRLDEEKEVPAILRAVAPDSTSVNHNH